MKFIYFGSSHFSCTVLSDLYERKLIPSLIVSQPDRPQGRGLKLIPMEISIFAASHALPLIKPASLKNNEVIEEIKKQTPDLFIVADYGKILKPDLLKIPTIMPLAVHPSLLPRYRGAAPVNWALINGETDTGVTIFKMNEKLDNGEILATHALAITENDTNVSLLTRCAHEGACLLMETIEKIKRNVYTLTPQEDARATYAPKLKKADGIVTWNSSAAAIQNLIRGTVGWPSAYTTFKKTLIQIISAKVLTQETLLAPSTIIAIHKEGITVATGKGSILITRVKPQGKKEMDAYAFVLGHSMRVGEKFIERQR
jgi:methionyl-tRNA formyltransferase